MTEKLKQTTKEELIKLPKEAQDAVNSMDWATLVEEIGKKYLLDESEINALQVETLLVLIGVQTLESFPENIENEIKTSKDESLKISNEAFKKIFEPIVEKLKENIKKNLNEKNITWDQSVDFIISGGDYTSFIKSNKGSYMAPEEDTKLIGSSNILEVKNKLIN